MGQTPRTRPEHLPGKLLAIRKQLKLSQTQMAEALGYSKASARVCEYEHGTREPNLMVLLAYARAARVPVEYLIDDDLDLKDAV